MSSKSDIAEIEACTGLMLKKGWAKNHSTVSPGLLKGLNASDATILCGKQFNDFPEWRNFKEQFVAYQTELGFVWSAGQGHGGPLELTEVRYPEWVGQEIAKKLLARDVPKGTLGSTVRDFLPNADQFIADAGAPLELGDLRKGFKEFAKEGVSYRFSPGRGSSTYTMAVETYSYLGKSKSRKREELFGDAIEDKVKALFELDKVKHIQRKRKGRKYENADIVGFKIARRMEGDKFFMYSFEVKPANDIGSISQAISQAVNYRSRANFTYIVIPQMDYSSFHDNDRLADLLAMCRDNSIGALSINLNTDSHEILDVVEVQSAIDTGLDDSEWLADLVGDSDIELCPLCRKIVNQKTRALCGWSIYKEVKGDGTADELSEKLCMKRGMEEQMRK